jgi:hypothetical protein
MQEVYLAFKPLRRVRHADGTQFLFYETGWRTAGGDELCRMTWCRRGGTVGLASRFRYELGTDQLPFVASEQSAVSQGRMSPDGFFQDDSPRQLGVLGGICLNRHQFA